MYLEKYRYCHILYPRSIYIVTHAAPVYQRQWIILYRKGGDCRIALVIPDTPVSAILLLHYFKKTGEPTSSITENQL